MMRRIPSRFEHHHTQHFELAPFMQGLMHASRRRRRDLHRYRRFSPLRYVRTPYCWRNHGQKRAVSGL